MKFWLWFSAVVLSLCFLLQVSAGTDKPVDQGGQKQVIVTPPEFQPKAEVPKPAENLTAMKTIKCAMDLEIQVPQWCPDYMSYLVIDGYPRMGIDLAVMKLTHKDGQAYINGIRWLWAVEYYKITEEGDFYLAAFQIWIQNEGFRILRNKGDGIFEHVKVLNVEKAVEDST